MSGSAWEIRPGVEADLDPARQLLPPGGAPDRRRRGIATALVQAGEERLRDLGCIRSSAIAIGDEEAAVGFWQACGYRHQPEVGRFVRMLDG